MKNIISVSYTHLDVYKRQTNDIDVNTLRALEEGLEDFAGCAVIISHDRWFLDRICTHILLSLIHILYLILKLLFLVISID